MNDDNEGMRIKRRGRPRKIPRAPSTLAEAETGKVYFVAVRVGAHFGRPQNGERVDTLVRLFDRTKREELYGCGDLLISRSALVDIYNEDDE